MAAHKEGAERLAETWKPARRKRNHEQTKDHLSLALCQREQQISLSQQATEAHLIGFFSGMGCQTLRRPFIIFNAWGGWSPAGPRAEMCLP